MNGVETVRHTGARAAVPLELETSIGLLGGAADEASPEEFGRVESVIADDAGRMYVADGFAMEIRVFSPDGAFERRIGRAGEGPGEIGGTHGIAWLTGDTLVIVDYGNARLSLVSSSGVALGQWPWVRLTGGTRFFFNGGPGEMYAHSFQNGASVWVRYTTEGPQDTISIPQRDPPAGTNAMCRGDGIGFMQNPFGTRFISRPAPGSARVMAWTSEYRIAFVDPAGDTVRVITRDVAPTSLADSLWAPVEEEYAEFRAAWSAADCEGEITRPAVRPVLEDLYFDEAGRLLVEYATESGSAFDVFGHDGVLQTTFLAPPDRDPTVPPSIRGDRLYVVVNDDLDVQQVRSYRIGALEGGRE